MTGIGTELAGAVEALGVEAGEFGRVLGTHRSAAAVEVVAEGMAAALSEFAPEVLLSWDTSDDAVLQHAVARRLGARSARVTRDQGMLFVEPEDVVGGRSVALVGACWDDPTWLAALQRVVAGHGGRVVAVGAALDSAALTTLSGVPGVLPVDPARP
jgi:hypothetical protein